MGQCHRSLGIVSQGHKSRSWATVRRDSCADLRDQWSLFSSHSSIKLSYDQEKQANSNDAYTTVNCAAIQHKSLIDPRDKIVL